MKNKILSFVLVLVLSFSVVSAFEGPTAPPNQTGVFGNAGRIMRTFFDNAFVNNNPFATDIPSGVVANSGGSLLGRLGFIVDQINALKSLFFSGGKLRASALPAEGVWNNTGGIVISSGSDSMIAMTGGDITLNANNLNFSGSVVVTGGLSVNGVITGVLATASQPGITSVGTLGSLSVNGSVVVTGGLSVNGGITGTLTTASQPGITSVGTLGSLNVVGVTDGSSAGMGMVGEYITAKSTGTTALSWKSMVSITLTPGDWDVYGSIFLSVPNEWISSMISSTSPAPTSGPALSIANTQSAEAISVQTASGSAWMSNTIMPTRFNITSNTTIYFYTRAEAAVLVHEASISARRVR